MHSKQEFPIDSHNWFLQPPYLPATMHVATSDIGYYFYFLKEKLMTNSITIA